MLRKIAGGILLCVAAWAQNLGTPVNQVDAPPIDPYTHLYFYDGSNNLIYECRSPQNQFNNNLPGNPGYFSVAQGNLTNIVVAAGTATINFPSTSFMWVGMQVVVAGSATTALNGTYKILTVSGSTATFTTAAGNGTYVDASVSTLSPQVNQAVWAIHAFVYVGTTVQSSYWAGGVSQGKGVACSNRANF
jgi:hypothetical protein